MAMAEMAPAQQKIVGKSSSPFPSLLNQHQQQQQQHNHHHHHHPQQQQQQQQQQMMQQQNLIQQQQQQQNLIQQQQQQQNLIQQQQQQQSLIQQQQQQQGLIQQQLQQQQQQSLIQQQLLKQKQLKDKDSQGFKKPEAVEVEMARQDLVKVCNPDIHRPFSSFPDACERLLPYHIVAEYDSEPEPQASGTTVSMAQLWNDALDSRSRDYFLALQKQIAMYNLIVRKRREGEMRGEERLLLEQFLLEDEKQKLAELKSQLDARDRADKEAAEAKVKDAERAAKLEMNLNVKAAGNENMYWESEEDGDGQRADGEPDGDEEAGDGAGDGEGEEEEEEGEEGDEQAEAEAGGEEANGDDAESEDAMEEEEQEEEESGTQRRSRRQAAAATGRSYGGWGRHFDLNARSGVQRR